MPLYESNTYNFTDGHRLTPCTFAFKSVDIPCIPQYLCGKPLEYFKPITEETLTMGLMSDSGVQCSITYKFKKHTCNCITVYITVTNLRNTVVSKAIYSLFNNQQNSGTWEVYLVIDLQKHLVENRAVYNSATKDQSV